MWRGARDEKGAMARPTTVKTLPRIVGVAGGRDEHRREDKENQSQNPPAGYHRGGGGKTRDENQHKMEGGTIHSPARGGRANLKTHLKEKTKQRASQRKEDKTYSPVQLCE